MKRMLISIAFHIVAIPVSIGMALILIPMTILEWVLQKQSHVKGDEQ